MSALSRGLDEPNHLHSRGCGEAASAHTPSCGTRGGIAVCNPLSLAVPSSVALALGALTLWHAALITRGETSIERHINKKERQRLQKKGKVSAAPGAGGPPGAEPDVMCVSLACRSSGTPTATAAGITGRCSWVWTRQGKAPAQEGGGSVVCGGAGTLGVSFGQLGQSRTVSIPCVRCAGH